MAALGRGDLKRRVRAHLGVVFGATVLESMNLARWRVVRAQRRLVWAAGVLVLVLAGAALVWVDPSSLCVLPAVGLALLLKSRRYPGERMIVALSRARNERRGRPADFAPRAARIEIARPRGGLLLACALAVRPPPAPLRATA